MSSFAKYIAIAIVGALLFFPFLGHVHLFDWDEINFAECAREMIETDNYLQVQINYQPFWEKPPLFIWMQVLSMKLFGVNEYAARFPNAIIGILTLLSIFYIGRRVVNENMALWWVGLYMASWLPHFYFKSGIIDPTFNLLIFLSFYQLYLVRFGIKKYMHALLFGLFMGMAVLTKGPVAILITILSALVYIILNKGFRGYALSHILVMITATMVTTFSWFAVEVWSNGWWMVEQFITYQIRLFNTQDAGHGGPFIYHFIVLLVGCFPASIFLLNKVDVCQEKEVVHYKRWMWVLFWVVLLLFSIVKTKIVHYSSLCYFPLTFLAAYNLYYIAKRLRSLSTISKIAYWVVGISLGLAITLLPLVGVYKNALIPYINDPFAVSNLQADVHWSSYEMLYGLIYLSGIVLTWLFTSRYFKRYAFIFLFIIQVFIIQVTITHFTPKIEAYSQRAAIEYFKSLQGRDVHVHVLGYKSYAHLFYSLKKPQPAIEEEILLNGNIDKPAYFICKIMNADKYSSLPQLKETGRKNGFVFFVRQ